MRLVVSNCSKTIHGIPVLENVSLEAQSGMVVGLAGVNGSGKTMLLRAISGLIAAGGTIEIDGEKVGQDIDFPSNIGVLIENPAFLPSRTGLDNLMLLLSLEGCRDCDVAKRALASVGLSPDDNRKYRKYSLGMRQRLGLAAAFMNNHGILFLMSQRMRSTRMVSNCSNNSFAPPKKRGAILIVASHDMSVFARLLRCRLHDGRRQNNGKGGGREMRGDMSRS